VWRRRRTVEGRGGFAGSIEVVLRLRSFAALRAAQDDKLQRERNEIMFTPGGASPAPTRGIGMRRIVDRAIRRFCFV
jgi:hypothetical protein